MKDNQFKTIRDEQVDLETHEEMLRILEVHIFRRLPEQNNRLEKLWKAYKKLGLIDEEKEKFLQKLTKEKFLKEYNQIHDSIKLIKSNPIPHEDLYESQRQVEQSIADMMTLIQTRWYTCAGFINLYRKERMELKQQENRLQNEYTELTVDTNIHHAKLLEKADLLFNKHKQLIEDQKIRIYKEEIILGEMESLIELREQYFEIAKDVFGI